MAECGFVLGPDDGPAEAGQRPGSSDGTTRAARAVESAGSGGEGGAWRGSAGRYAAGQSRPGVWAHGVPGSAEGAGGGGGAGAIDGVRQPGGPVAGAAGAAPQRKSRSAWLWGRDDGGWFVNC